MTVLNSIRDSESAQLILIALITAAADRSGHLILLRIRRKPKDREQKRRLAVNLNGRLGDAMITEVHDNVVFYEYTRARRRLYRFAGCFEIARAHS